mgnify:CR=1 FL=1
MIDPNHPAVEAVAREIYAHDAPSNDPQAWPPTPTALADDYRGAAIAALTAALPHLVSPDDPRPWEPLAPGDPLHAGDEVWRWWCGVSTRGIFDVQHPDSQVYTAERGHLGHRAIGTWCVRRRIPAPTPPAEEVELPGVPCALTDVRLREALAAGVALWTGREVVVSGFNGCASAHPAQDLAAFTLPDGTRARRDGEHEDGTPRFVKAGEGEK